jgi:glycosyltransferase involved in cell wall biosynthesis
VRQSRPVPIAIFLSSFDPGGTEHQMTELAARLDRRLFEVHVACLRDEGALRRRVEGTAASIQPFALRTFKSAHAVRQMVRFAGWCRERGIRVVQTCDFYATVFGIPGAALAGVPVRIASRRDIVMPERTPGQERLQRIAYQFAHRVVANSAAAADRLIEEGVADWKVVSIANGLDPDRFAPPQPKKRRRVITTVANLRPGKGHDVLLRAAARVLRRVPDATFQIVGDGPRRAELERQAAALRVAGQVRFFGHRHDVPELLQASDIFAFPSLMEAAPNALLEAMVAGLPVVASRAGGMLEVVEHGHNGLLVPPGDERALAAAILRLIERPGLAARLAEAARASIEARFSFDRMVGEFQQLYLHEIAERVAPEVLTWAASSAN